MITYLVIKRIGVTRNREDAKVSRWNRKMVNIIEPDATVKAPRTNRTMFVTSNRRERPELPLRPALTLCPTIFRQITNLKWLTNCSKHKHDTYEIQLCIINLSDMFLLVTNLIHHFLAGMYICNVKEKSSTKWPKLKWIKYLPGT